PGVVDVGDGEGPDPAPDSPLQPTDKATHRTASRPFSSRMGFLSRGGVHAPCRVKRRRRRRNIGIPRSLRNVYVAQPAPPDATDLAVRASEPPQKTPKPNKPSTTSRRIA